MAPGNFSPPVGNRRTLLWMACGLVWVGAIAAGTRAMLNYENRPGPAGVSPRAWPADSAIQRPSGLPMLVVFGHPHCPCTRATIGELALIMARLKGQLSAEVVFIRPVDTSENWERTDLWRSAASIPGVRVISDVGGIEADRFHAQISGQTMLYSSGGNLLFSGGITASRGHSGDNAGRTAIVALVTGGQPGTARSPVFGCYLQHDSIQRAGVIRSDKDEAALR